MELDIKPKLEIKNSGAAALAECQSINFYRTPPFGLLTLEQCEDLFRQRLEALHIMESTKDLTVNNIPFVAKALRDIKSYVYKTNCLIPRINDKQQKKLDHFSHMLTRMFCMQSQPTWSWFKSCEKKLLYYRLRDQAASLSGNKLDAILRSFNFDFERIIGSELSQLYQEKLVGWSTNTGERDVPDLFKVDFTHALTYVARRSVVLKDGFAYLTRFEIISVVCDIFDKHLDQELKYAHQHLDTQQMQVQQLLEALSVVYCDFIDKVNEARRLAKKEQGGDAQNMYNIDIYNIDEAVKKHYPPCMRYMHEALMQDHHLKHQGRLYYGAFLRSAGVDQDDAIAFWRKEFTKKIPNERFERDYKYNIRHLYGREGHKKALSCFRCEKIIKDNAPGPADKHGCPFRHFDEPHLRGLMAKYGVGLMDIESIVQLSKDKQYQEACSRYFSATRDGAIIEPVWSPIHFYRLSNGFANRPHSSAIEDIKLENESVKTENEGIKMETEDLKLENEEDWCDTL